MTSSTPRLLRTYYRETITCIVVAVLLIDQSTKWIASSQGNMVINTGISFGQFSGPLLTAALIGFFVVVFEWSCPRWHRAYPIASGLFLGGGLSNIIDRIVVGGVRDFLPVPLLGVQNNIADWAVVIGLGYIFWQEFRKSPKA